jgi:hypothetical protein
VVGVSVDNWSGVDNCEVTTRRTGCPANWLPGHPESATRRIDHKEIEHD